VTPAPQTAPEPGTGQNAGVTGARLTVAGTPSADPMLAPIRYADSGVDERGGAYDGTAGLVYDAATADFPQPGTDYDEPVDEGISILGDIPTTVVPDDEPPTADLEPVRYEDSTGVDLAPVGAAWNQPITAPPAPVWPSQTGQPQTFGQRLGGLVNGPSVDAYGNPRQSLRDLPPDLRHGLWRNRVILVAVVGVLFGGVTRNIAIGVTLAILAGIADTIYRARTAGDILTGGSVLAARKKTRKQLAKMRRSGYFTLDARPIPNSRETIDHLVVGPTGVYAIDSEKWHPKLPIRTWNGKKLYHGPESKKDRLEHAKWEAKQASDILSAALGVEIEVRPAMAIYGPKVPWKYATIRDVDVFTGPALRKYLRRRGKMRAGVQRLTREQVRTIYDTATRVLPGVAPTMNPTPVG
jgi:hypothetical protein